ncbi:hypothetical protein Natoc_2498 [Natronococcus occultus SP4]|uniref:Uncharacterized protein n=1 Tax=Natronococcus occultus SP4 TaxID=694430 RepID=L0K146_9EURY|nr:hypothetical protein Natoc_2498 [Natronococcus occultus SP4]
MTDETDDEQTQYGGTEDEQPETSIDEDGEDDEDDEE